MTRAQQILSALAHPQVAYLLLTLGMLVHGEATDDTDDRGRPIQGDTMLLILNNGDGDLHFTLLTKAFGMSDVTDFGYDRTGAQIKLINELLA